MTCSSKEPKDPRQWREVLECLPVGLSVVNARLELVAWNQRFFDLLDFPGYDGYKSALAPTFAAGQRRRARRRRPLRRKTPRRRH